MARWRMADGGWRMALGAERGKGDGQLSWQEAPASDLLPKLPLARVADSLPSPQNHVPLHSSQKPSPFSVTVLNVNTSLHSPCPSSQDPLPPSPLSAPPLPNSASAAAPPATAPKSAATASPSMTFRDAEYVPTFLLPLTAARQAPSEPREGGGATRGNGTQDGAHPQGYAQEHLGLVGGGGLGRVPHLQALAPARVRACKGDGTADARCE